MPGAKAVRVIGQEREALYLIDLPQEMPGFRNFIAAWLLVTLKYNYLVDPGPAATIPQLCHALEELSVHHLDYILLTHLHIDHAGGTGELLERFPQAKVLAHPRGRQYLVHPVELWKGSVKVLGEIALKYGEMQPVPEASLLEKAPGVEVIETPGHAFHHLSFLFKNILFAGETAGVYQKTDGAYLRPATPPRFFFEVAVNSLDKLLSLDLGNKLICHGHYGFNTAARELLISHRRQLFLWRDVVARTVARCPGAHEEELLCSAWEELRRRDPLLASFTSLPPDIQQREEYFILNSLKGFLQSLADTRDSPPS